nr:isoform 2 of nuclear factor nf-kappa-b p105 [Quercus suber]
MNAAELFDAAISGNVNSFSREIGDGVLISLDQWTSCRGNTILHAAAKSGENRIMGIVLNSLSPHSPLYTPNFKGNTALHIAVSLGRFDMSLLLISRAVYQGAEVKRLLLRAKNVEQDTALHLAVKHGHYDIVVLLITEDPKLTLITNNAGESPLFLAVDRGFFEIALRILEIQECSDEGRKNMNVLHAAVIRVEIKSWFKTIRKDWWQNIQTCLNIFGSSQLKTRKLDITGAGTH